MDATETESALRSAAAAPVPQDQTEFEAFKREMTQQLDQLGILANRLNSVRTRTVGPRPPQTVGSQDAKSDETKPTYTAQMADLKDRLEFLCGGIAEDLDALSQF